MSKLKWGLSGSGYITKKSRGKTFPVNERSGFEDAAVSRADKQVRMEKELKKRSEKQSKKEQRKQIQKEATLKKAKEKRILTKLEKARIAADLITNNLKMRENRKFKKG